MGSTPAPHLPRAVPTVEGQRVSDRLKILVFRAAGHNLASRLRGTQLATAVGAIGLRDVKGSGILALHARVAGVTEHGLNRALRQKTIVNVVSARGADALVPAGDVAIFTLGTLPADEESLRVRLKPFLPVLDRSGHSATEALELAKTIARRTLARGPVGIAALSGALTRALPELSPMCRGRCGTAHIDQGLFDLVGESGVWRHETIDEVRMYVPMDEPSSREEAREEIVRRYLRCYGPSTAAHFAAWCGIGTKDAARSLIDAETTDIGARTYVLTEDLGRLESLPQSVGVRILPPRDPYLLGRDRATLVPDREVQKRIWRATPTDGVVLVSGEPVATWRPTKTGNHLRLNVQSFKRLRKDMLAELGIEAAEVAQHRGCASSEVVVV